MRGGKTYGKKKKPRKKRPGKSSGNPFGMTYHQMLREGEMQSASCLTK